MLLHEAIRYLRSLLGSLARHYDPVDFLRSCGVSCALYKRIALSHLKRVQHPQYDEVKRGLDLFQQFAEMACANEMEREGRTFMQILEEIEAAIGVLEIEAVSLESDLDPESPTADVGEVTDTPKGNEGVTMLDAALCLDGDVEIARAMVKRWQRRRVPKLESIGIDPKHSQAKLYAPAAMLKYIKKIEGNISLSDASLLSALKAKARQPRIQS